MVDTTSKQPVQVKTTIPLTEQMGNNGRKMPSIIFIENVDDYAEKYGHERLVEEINVYYRYIQSNS
jgi:hypothetical protein